MKYYLFFSFFISFLFNINSLYADTLSPKLFPIFEKSKWGYIDSTGKIKIQPQFDFAYEFSEGLANVRSNGYYGFIDSTGKFVIEPKFEFAEPFNNNVAVVYGKNGKMEVINKTGTVLFKNNYKSINNFKNEVAIITTFTNKKGMIDKENNLVLDTIYDSIIDYLNKEFYVIEIKKIENYKSKIESGLINKFGKIIIPVNQYPNIYIEKNSPFFKVYKNISDPNQSYNNYSILDINLNVIASKSNGKLLLDGLVKLKKKNDVNQLDIYYFEHENKFYLLDTTDMSINLFNDEVILYKNENDKYFIINKDGNILSKKSYRNAISNFNKGRCVVLDMDYQKYILDKNENIISTIEYLSDGKNDPNYYFTSLSSNDFSKYEYARVSFREFIGVCDLDGKTIIEPTLLRVNENRFQNGLLKCDFENKLCYYNTDGKIVWSDTSNISEYNYDIQRETYCGINPIIQKIDKKDPLFKSNNIPKGKISIVLSEESDIKYNKMFYSNSILIFNNSKEDKSFLFQAGSLDIKLEALNENNEWKEIERFYTTPIDRFEDCNLEVKTQEAKTYWKYIIPRYFGSIKTKIRAKFQYYEPASKIGKKVIIYSNEINGSVNPAQFWNKKDIFFIDFLKYYYK
ncbi:MAG: WG repeat-containing protein [Saprospiraceae bacterium]|nr:WG repeat-containing protein [Saprospiraceae bacterium]